MGALTKIFMHDIGVGNNGVAYGHRDLGQDQDREDPKKIMQRRPAVGNEFREMNGPVKGFRFERFANEDTKGNSEKNNH